MVMGELSKHPRPSTAALAFPKTNQPMPIVSRTHMFVVITSVSSLNLLVLEQLNYDLETRITYNLPFISLSAITPSRESDSRGRCDM